MTGKERDQTGQATDPEGHGEAARDGSRGCIAAVDNIWKREVPMDEATATPMAPSERGDVLRRAR